MKLPSIRRKEVIGIFLALLLLASPVASSSALAGLSATSSPDAGAARENVSSAGMGGGAITFQDSSLIEVRDGVSVWERALFPLRTDDGSAVHSSANTQTNVRVESRNVEQSLNKPTLSVHQSGSTVELTFLPGRVSASTDMFDGGQVQLVAARIDGDRDVPESQNELEELVTANDSATYSIVDERAMNIHDFELNGVTVTGDEFSFTPAQSGQYVLFLAAPEDGTNGFEVTADGNITTAGNVTVFGLDTVTVHEESSIVDAPDNVATDENATFDVQTPGASGDDVNHTIVLYDEDTFSSATNTFIFDNATASSNVEIQTEIERVNGEIRVENGSSVFIADSSERALSPSTTPSAVADTILADRSNVTVVGDVVLNASLTAVHGPADTTITVGIPDNWTNEEYRWIHVATTSDGSIVGSNAGDLTVGPSGDDDDDSPNTGGGDPPRNDDDRDDTTSDDGDRSASVNVRTDDGRTSVTIENVGADEVIQVEANAAGGGPASPTLDRLNVSFTEATDANLVITGDRGSTPPVNADADLGYFNVSHDVSDETTGSVTFAFRVETERLEERGVSADDVTLYRYHDGEWNALETRHVGTSGDDELFEAESPGLSVFAVSTRGALDPAFEVTDASVDSDSIETGESVSVTATVENTGASDGTYTAELVIDGETVAQQDVTVPAGESETVAFTHTFDQAGTYDVAVGDTAAGTVEVTGTDTSTETSTNTATTTGATGTPPDDLMGGGSLAVVLLVLIVLAGGVVFLYRSGRLDDFN